MKNEIGCTPLRSGRFAAALLVLAIGGVCAAAAQTNQRVYDTPQQAAEAAVAAAEKDDVAALLEIFGPDGKDLILSGDPVEDKNGRARFVAKAHERMQVTYDIANPTLAIVSVGDDDWPLPVPIVQRTNGKWRFNSKLGRAEVLARRIGGNELDAIALLRGYVDAQKDYASRERDGNGMLQYAQKVISTPGKQDGLSWKNADGTFGGPMGDELAEALAAGYTNKAAPYNGYYFRILKAQGSGAPKGARDYVVGGAMIGGFAMLAWPAQYGVSGIQTFQVNQDGIVYQKDLGPETSKLASQTTRYNPGKGWLVTEDEE
jgi:hypothetical protein